MRVSTLASSILGLASIAAAAPYYPFPLSDGFPAPSPAQLKAIEVAAGGSLPGGALATKLTAGAAATVQLIALNEIFEVAYFNELLLNVTNNVPGYTSFPTTTSRDFVIKTLTAIRNQEELHAIGANAILATAKETTIAPCKYNIPVTTFESAIALANTFTDVVLGVLPMAQTVFAADGGDELGYVNLVGSIIAQEAEQNGWYRSTQSKIPSAAPFLTTEGPSFAFSFLKTVIAPGCPGVDLVSKSVPTYPVITLLSSEIVPETKDKNLKFSVVGSGIDETEWSLVYLSGANSPTTVKIFLVSCIDNVTIFKAKFPFTTNGFAKGLTIAALVNKPAQAYANSAAVAAVTKYGPGIIELD